MMNLENQVLSIDIANELAGHIKLDTYFTWIAMEDMSGERIIKTSSWEKWWSKLDTHVSCPAPMMSEIMQLFPETLCIESPDSTGAARYWVQHYRFDGMFISELGDGPDGINGQWEGFADQNKPVDPCGKLAVWFLDNGYRDKLILKATEET